MAIDKKALSEADIRTKYITPAIEQAGWDKMSQMREEYSITAGRIIARGQVCKREKPLKADYVLFYKPNKPIAIVEAKDNNHSMSDGNVKKCAVGKHPKSEKHGNTAQFSEVERSGTQENCGGIGSGCRLRLRPLPVLHRRQSQRVARIDPNAVVVDKNIAENDRFDLFSR